MQTREIPRASWSEFFDDFSRDHVTNLVTVEVLGADVGAQVEAHDLPLVGLTVEGDEDTVWVALAKAADDHVTHGIHGVTHVRVEETAAGSAEALQIESRDGVTTIVRFAKKTH